MKKLNFDMATVRTICAMIAATFAAASYAHIIATVCH